MNIDLTSLLLLALMAVVSFAIGSINFSILIAMLLRRPDPRSYGSGNPGATNLSRNAGKAVAGCCLILDAVKSFLVVWLSRGVIDHGMVDALDNYQSVIVAAFFGFVSILGHCFSLYYGFRGGKGVAAALGVVFALSWQLGLLTLLSWLIGYVIFRASFMAALTAFSLLPIMIAVFGYPAIPQLGALILGGVALFFLMLYTHRTNIKNKFMVK